MRRAVRWRFAARRYCKPISPRAPVTAWRPTGATACTRGTLVVQGLDWDAVKDADKMLGLIETPARFQMGDKIGYGMMEFGFWSQFDKYM